MQVHSIIESTLARTMSPKVWQLPLTLPVARMRISDFKETILRFVPRLGFSGAPFAFAGFLPLVRTVLIASRPQHCPSTFG